MIRDLADIPIIKYYQYYKYWLIPTDNSILSPKNSWQIILNNRISDYSMIPSSVIPWWTNILLIKWWYTVSVYNVIRESKTSVKSSLMPIMDFSFNKADTIYGKTFEGETFTVFIIITQLWMFSHKLLKEAL